MEDPHLPHSISVAEGSLPLEEEDATILRPLTSLSSLIYLCQPPSHLTSHSSTLVIAFP